MESESSIETGSGIDNEPELNKYFKAAMKIQASDLHLKVGQTPKMRIQGHLRDTTGEVMTEQRIEKLVFEILTPNQKETFLKNGILDFAHELGVEDRFRVNIFRQRGFISLVGRRVSANIPPV